jgi:Alginate export
LNKIKVTGLLGSTVSLLSISAYALEPIQVGMAYLTPSLEVGAAAFSHKNQAFGGTASSFGFPVDRDAERYEGYAKYGVELSVPLTEQLTLSGKVSAISSLSRGDTDGLGITRDDPEYTDWEDGYLKLTAKELGWLDQASVSYGRQNFIVGDGFLLADGHPEQGHEGGYWFGTRKAYDNTLVFSADHGAFHFDAFSLRTRADVDVIDFKERVEIKGGNLQYNLESGGQVGYMHMRVTDNASELRDGLKVDDVRVINLPVPGVPDLKLSSEYVWQKNDDARARGWYAGASYTFSQVPWQPKLAYKYSEFSRGYDPLFYGTSGEWGTWVQGEVVGEYMLFNNNQTTSQFKLTLHPVEAVTAGAVLYKFDFKDKPDGVNNKDFAKELDLYVDWAPDAHWIVGGLIGVAKPGRGAEDLFGSRDTSHLFQAYAVYCF